MFEYCYPRLDVNVSKGMNHLLKSPFSIHPKTGRVSVPIDSNSLAHFDPCLEGSVPQLNELCQQVEQLPKQNQQNEDGSTDKAMNRHKGRELTVRRQQLSVSVTVSERTRTSLQNTWVHLSNHLLNSSLVSSNEPRRANRKISWLKVVSVISSSYLFSSLLFIHSRSEYDALRRDLISSHPNSPYFLSLLCIL